MSIFISLIKKETVHIVRDKRTMFITLLMPLMLLLLFGFAISTEVNDVRTAVVVDRHDDSTRNIILKLQANEYITFEGECSASTVQALLKKGSIDAAVVLRHSGNSIEKQIIVDSSNPTIGQTASTYLSNILNPTPISPVIMTTLYNPQMRSAYNFVPGIMGMIFILICAIMTSVSIVSEKEAGTMNLLLVSPVRPRVIIFGKLVPYFVLSLTILAVMLLISYTLLGLPCSASVFSVIMVSILYIALSLSIGLLVSTMVQTQVSALIVSAIMFMIPVIMFSGMIFPIDNMPVPLQWFSSIIPARWYISAMRKLMIQQLDLAMVTEEIAVLAAMTIIILALAIKKFSTRQS